MPRCPECGQYYPSGADVKGHQDKDHDSNPYGYGEETRQRMAEAPEDQEEAKKQEEAETTKEIAE